MAGVKNSGRCRSNQKNPRTREAVESGTFNHKARSPWPALVQDLSTNAILGGVFFVIDADS